MFSDDLKVEWQDPGTAWDTNAGKMHYVQKELWDELGQRGKGIIEMLSTQSRFRKRIKDFILNGAHIPSASEIAARATSISMLGFEESFRYHGVIYSDQIKEKLDQIPFPIELIEACKNTHILVLVPPFKLGTIHYQLPARILTQTPSLPNNWWNSEQYPLRENNAPGWYLVRIKPTPVVSYQNKKYWDQVRLNHLNEKVIAAEVMLYTMASYKLIPGKKIWWHNQLFRCKEQTTATNRHLAIGITNLSKISIEDVPDLSRSGNLYLGTAIEP